MVSSRSVSLLLGKKCSVASIAGQSVVVVSSIFYRHILSCPSWGAWVIFTYRKWIARGFNRYFTPTRKFDWFWLPSMTVKWWRVYESPEKFQKFGRCAASAHLEIFAIQESGFQFFLWVWRISKKYATSLKLVAHCWKFRPNLKVCFSFSLSRDMTWTETIKQTSF